jgi:hypothetical protein
MPNYRNAPSNKFNRLVLRPKENERAKGTRLWQELRRRRLLTLFNRLLTEDQDEDQKQRMATEIIQFIERRLLREPLPEPLPDGKRPLLAQSFEGTLMDVNDDFVTVEFDMHGRQELRRFARPKLSASGLQPQDVVQLRCELTLAPPTSPLSDAEVEQWEQRRVDRAAAQEKTRRARSLLEDES